MALLDVSGLTRDFGGLRAVSNLTFGVEAGEILGLIGPNGAGKTTVFNLVTGFLKPTAGEIRLDGSSIVGLRPHGVTRRGIARTFQIVKPFPALTARENVALAALVRLGDRAKAAAEAVRVLEQVGLGSRLDSPAADLTLSDQKRMEIARALATSPKLLLLDEPLAGLNANEMDDACRAHRCDPHGRRHGDPRRARHEGHHAHLRPRDRDAVRGEDRGRLARGRRGEPRRDRGLLRGAEDLSVLSVKGLEVAYGKVQVLWGVSFEVRSGEIVALVGANGAGKTTTIRTLSGLQKPKAGAILLDGGGWTRRRRPGSSDLGLIQVPEGRKLFPEMTVRENLLLGGYAPRTRAERPQRLEDVFGIFPILRDRQSQIAGTLSGGEQQMVAIGRGLMAGPKILILDEPSLGLAPIMVEEMFRVIRTINGRGVTVLLVEQNTEHALELAHRGYVLESGRVVLEGTGRDLLANPRVREAYLGL